MSVTVNEHEGDVRRESRLRGYLEEVRRRREGGGGYKGFTM